jgi:hypothetical protein
MLQPVPEHRPADLTAFLRALESTACEIPKCLAPRALRSPLYHQSTLRDWLNTSAGLS